MEIYNKIQNARKYIKTCDVAKKGHNDYSDYDYYTPVQISQLVFQACEDQKLFTKFNLLRNELGITGELIIINLEDPKEQEVFSMASAIPEIKATNAAQQLGGAMTYTERYLLMAAFDIKDNNLDPDTTENTKKSQPKKQQTEVKSKVLTQPEVENKWNGKIYKNNTVYIDNVLYSISIEQSNKLKTHPKYKEK